MNPMAKSVAELVEPAINDMGFELLGIEDGDQGRGALLRNYIDHEQGITLDDWAAVSHQTMSSGTGSTTLHRMPIASR